MNLQFFGGRGASSGKTNKGNTTATGTKSYDIIDVTLNADDPKAIDQIRNLAGRGEIPDSIKGSADAREKVYEEIAKLYGDPPGVLNEYDVKPLNQSGTIINILFTNNESHIVGIYPQPVKYLKRGEASELSKQGQRTYEILKMRDAAIRASVYRGGDGWPNLEFQRKWGGRVLSNSEKAQADKEIRSYVERIFKSSLTAQDIKSMNIYWTRVDGGWIRTDSRMNASRYGYDFTPMTEDG